MRLRVRQVSGAGCKQRAVPAGTHALDVKDEVQRVVVIRDLILQTVEVEVILDKLTLHLPARRAALQQMHRSKEMLEATKLRVGPTSV